MAVTLAVEGLDCGYPGRTVLAELELALEAGEVMGLVGANGSGKTTLIKTAAGLLAPRAGRVLVEGRDAASMAPRERARHLACVPQASRPAFPYRVLDFVLLGRAPHLGAAGRPGPADAEVARGALAELGIAELAPRAVTELSSGQLQLVLLARALAQQPRVLLLDEPAASLDLAHQLRLLELLAALARRGIAVLMATHHPDHVLSACHRVALLAGGRLLAQGPPGQALTGERLQQVYGVPVTVLEVLLPSGEKRPVCVPERAP